MKTSARENQSASALRAIIAFAVIALLVIVMFFTGRHVLERQAALTVLYRAKVVRLAAWAVSTECYGKGTEFADYNTETGFAGGLADAVLAMSESEGEVRLNRTEKNGYGVAELTYREGDYLAIYTATDENGAWRVIKEHIVLTS